MKFEKVYLPKYASRDIGAGWWGNDFDYTYHLDFWWWSFRVTI